MQRTFNLVVIHGLEYYVKLYESHAAFNKRRACEGQRYPCLPKLALAPLELGSLVLLLSWLLVRKGYDTVLREGICYKITNRGI
jgi:hypothetical protein